LRVHPRRAQNPNSKRILDFVQALIYHAAMTTLKQWQTVQQAAKEARCTAQAIYLAISQDEIETTAHYGRMLVPRPLPYRPDRLRQRRAKLSK